MSVTSTPPQRIVLDGIRWETYASLLEDLERRQRRVRISYDRGVLEIVTPSRQHERRKHLLGRMVEAMTEVLRIPISGGGSTTWKRADLEQGVEPDECYWVQNEAAVRDRDELDMLIDPPPDLAIEIELHSSSANRLSIYAVLGVPEVWRHTGDRLTVHLLRSDGSYSRSESSRAFPGLPMAEFAAWLDRRRGQDETAWIRAFRDWVRETSR